ncbi:MAG TPA: NnrU family protein [Alphaproteobacteria bacterium]
MAGSTTSTVLYAALVFVFIHVLSSTPLRARIVSAIGEGPFRGLFSLISAAALLWLLVAYGRAPYVELWAPAPWTRWIPIVVMPFASILFVFGLTLPNPLSVGQEARIEATEPAAGFLKVTRHPLFWSFALWAAAHIPPNGDLASLYLFGSILLLSLVGMPLVDKKKEARFGAAWGPFALTTSVVPFVAAIEGRAKLTLADFSLWRVVAGLALYVVLFAAHPLLIGVPVLV